MDGQKDMIIVGHGQLYGHDQIVEHGHDKISWDGNMHITLWGVGEGDKEHLDYKRIDGYDNGESAE